MAQYQVSLAKLLIASAQSDQADLHIAKVRQLGRLGQNESLARELERLSAQARRERISSNRTSPPKKTGDGADGLDKGRLD